MSIEMKVMYEKVQPHLGLKMRRFEGDPFENIHSFNFAAAQRYIGSKGISDQTNSLQRSVIFTENEYSLILSFIVKTSNDLCNVMQIQLIR